MLHQQNITITITISITITYHSKLMFHNIDRRILKFPAVHPCEGISPAILVDSLIVLARKITNYHSKSFSTQKRNARQTIRLIQNLLLYFEEIQESKLILPNSVVLCFSELHLTFQRILFLLNDCTREGARVWILMKAHFVATQFRDIIRTVATALDVLPLNSIDVSRETRELVELVLKQALKAKVELDINDDNAMRKVILILNHFENGFETDPIMMRRVVNYLGIRSWSECNKEVKFLEEEIGWGCLEDNNERELPLLSSLIGMMCYCRAILFEDCDIQGGDHSEGRLSDEVGVSLLNLEDFRCPISLEMMVDPVTVSTGQTYDRASIQKWFKAGNLLCPKTGEVLSTTELVPNSSLSKIIHQFCADHGVSLAKTRKKNRDISRTILPGSPAAAEAIRFLSQFLTARLSNGTDKQKYKAAYEIRLLGKSNIFNRFCLIKRGTIPPLLTLLASTDSSTQENAIAALMKLSKHSNGKKMIVDSGGLELIVTVLNKGLKVEAQQTAAAIIFYLSSVSKYRKLIGEETEAIPALVELIRNGTSCGKKNGVVAIFGLLLWPQNHHKVLAAGTVPLIVDILSTSDKTDLVTDSLAILAKLSESFDGSNVIGQATTLSTILRVFKGSSSRSGKEYCASILLSLCNYCGGDVVGVLAKDPTLMSSLYSLVMDGDGTSSSGKKARSVIRIIHRFHETTTSQLMTNGFQEEQSIHVR